VLLGYDEEDYALKLLDFRMNGRVKSETHTL
jgi:hypothetical protein